jgi:hypothetical protein
MIRAGRTVGYIIGCVAIFAIATNAEAHCDLAYSAGPAIAYKFTPKEVVESRTSIDAALEKLTRTQKSGSAHIPAMSFARMTASQVQAALPPDVANLTATELNARQKALTYWLLYIRKFTKKSNSKML